MWHTRENNLQHVVHWVLNHSGLWLGLLALLGAACQPPSPPAVEQVIQQGRDPVAWREGGSQIVFSLSDERTFFSVSVDPPAAPPVPDAWSDDGFCPRFTRDGNTLLAFYNGTLQRLDAPRGGQIPMPIKDEASCPAWAPDGQTFALVTNIEGEAYYLSLFDRDGVYLRTLYTGTMHIGDMAWAPDGQKIAFVMTPDGEEDLYAKRLHIVNVSDGGLFRLNEGRELSRAPHVTRTWSQAPTWSPDSQHIAYIEAFVGTGGNLALIRVDGTHNQYLLQGKAEVPFSQAPESFIYAKPLWSPRGDYIAVTRLPGYVAYPDMLQIYSEADLLLLPVSVAAP